METSPLRFLDFDASKMLADQVRISQEDEARRFHKNIWTASGTLDTRVLKGSIHRVLSGLARYWGDLWDEELSGAGLKSARYRDRETIKRRIMLYEQELIIIMNTRGNRF